MWLALAFVSAMVRSRRSIRITDVFGDADFAYLSALRQPDSMISVVSLVRRSSVIVSFLCGAIIFKERNLKAKALDLAFILVGMLFIWIGSR